MVSLEKPNVELFNLYADRVEVTFNKYIDVSTINTSSIKLYDNKGNELSAKEEKCIIKILGQLPGEAEITLKIEGTDLEEKIKVNLLLSEEEDTTETPLVTENKLVGDNRYKIAIKLSNEG